jgi:hypothetical protein
MKNPKTRVIADPWVLIPLHAVLFSYWANPLANVEISLLAAWIVPLMVGLPVGVLAARSSHRRYVAKAAPDAAWPQLDAVLVCIVSLCVVGAATYWATRNTVQAIGAIVPGTSESIRAHLVHIGERTRSIRTHCKQDATIQVPGSSRAIVCVVSSWRSLTREELSSGTTIALDVEKNLVGTRVTRIRTL